MLLAIDIGNSNIVIGGIDEEKIRFEARIATDRIKTSDQYGVEIKNMLDLFRVAGGGGGGLYYLLRSAAGIQRGAHRRSQGDRAGAHRGGTGHQDRAEYQMDDPASVGSDRIVIAVAALQEYKPPSSWWTWGRPPPWRWWTTGTPIWAAASSRGPSVGGGSVQPGLPSCRASSWTSPGGSSGRIPWSVCAAGSCTVPPPCWTGCWTGWREELGKRTTVVVTGGMAQFIAPCAAWKMMVEKDLLLKGLYAIYKKNKSNGGSPPPTC